MTPRPVRAGGPDWPAGQQGWPPDLARTHRRLILHRTIATGNSQRCYQKRNRGDLSAWRPDEAKNSFADTTVESIVLEVFPSASTAKAWRPHRRVVR
jgi:hypothetical protein